ncbi:NAD(P)/FAD-dependent oxidoreductase, partial [Candidatus Sumerlaeota bacterium]|nr:NAD(P)/FAD-dependent oxidoreductase [Candidatus Sumerlaeota bacterium]
MAENPTNHSKTINTEVAVIGAGPGGYAAAFRAADKGKKVVLIDDRAAPGGVCLHVGCIPSKALLHVAALKAEARAAKRWGIAYGEPKIDLDAMRAWKDETVAKLTGGVLQLCKSRGVRYLQGRAVFIDSERLRIEDSETEMVIFQKAIIATGSSPVIPKGLDLKSPRLMNSTGALELKEIPKTLLIVGGGYIGLEMGTVYAELGSKVTVVEMTDGLLPGVDRDLVRPVGARMKELTEAIHLETKVVKIEEAKNGLRVVMEKTVEWKTETLDQTFDRVLVSAGRRPNSSGLGIENTKAKVNARGFIEVNAQRRTADENIYAIGDV